jgi:hypothetical protein
MSTSEVTTALDSIIEKIYVKFFLRDFFGKIIPGLVLIVSLFFFIVGDYNKLLEIKQVNWVFLIGLAWIVAFGIQSIGRYMRIIIFLDPQKYPGEKGWLDDFYLFWEVSNQYEKDCYERFVVIKESTGNLGISLIISNLLIIIRLLINNTSIYNPIFYVPCGFIFIFSCFLIRMNRRHAIKQCDYIVKIAELRKNDKVNN